LKLKAHPTTTAVCFKSCPLNSLDSDYSGWRVFVKVFYFHQIPLHNSANSSLCPRPLSAFLCFILHTITSVINQCWRAEDENFHRVNFYLSLSAGAFSILFVGMPDEHPLLPRFLWTNENNKPFGIHFCVESHMNEPRCRCVVFDDDGGGGDMCRN
jgi:hypothetical protein